LSIVFEFERTTPLRTLAAGGAHKHPNYIL